MPAFALNNQIPFFHDLSGEALENGKIYVGEPGEDPVTHPITVYWNKELTTSASQPIRTVAGHTKYSGALTPLYVGQDCSIAVYDEDDNLIYSITKTVFSEYAFQTVAALLADTEITYSADIDGEQVVAGPYTYTITSGSGTYTVQTAGGTYLTIDEAYRHDVQAWGVVEDDDITTILQAAIDSLPTGGLQNADYSGASNPYTMNSGRVIDLKRVRYTLSDTILLPPNVHLHQANLLADTGTTWNDIDGDTVDLADVTAGGTNYTQDTVSVAVTGGGGSGCEAEAIVSGGSVIQVFITEPGSGYSSAPTLTINDSGTGAGATATAELSIMGKPMISEKTPNSEYRCFNAGITGKSYIDCANVCDPYRFSGKSPILDVTTYRAKHNGGNLLGADMATGLNIESYSAGRHGLFTSYNWGHATSQTCNEFRCVNLTCKFSGKREFRGTYTNSLEILGGTLTASGTSIPAEIHSSTTGGDISVKIEHEGIDQKPSVVLEGNGFDFDLTSAPKTPVAHFKWCLNFGGGNMFKWTANQSVLSQRIDNPNLANDISPFMSLKSKGLIVTRIPYNTESRLEKYHDWCKDMDGNQQYATKFIMLVPHVGNGSGFAFEKADFEAKDSSTLTVRIYVTGDADERMRIYPTGEIRWGDGTNSPDVLLTRPAANILALGNNDGFGIGNSVNNTNTPSGATAKAIEIFDHDGNSLGYIPVYAAQW